ncbi:MAG: hypothetical protein KF862_09755 [Chitinophagaceae bacterium]|nr:hypothetical protein [Chitinophagaceae bacterium]
MNTKALPLLLLYIATVNSLFSQHYYYNNYYYDRDLLFEVSASAGAMNCLTDIGGTEGIGRGFLKDLNIANTRFSAGVSGGFIYRYAIGLRIEANTGAIQAYDSILKNDPSEGRYRYKRNLNFRSPVSELLLLAELYPLKALFPVKEDEKAPAFAPYITGGIGVFRFRPQANLNGIWVDLAPLHTEGQGFAEYPERKTYRLTQLCFPVGVGCKYELSALFNIRLEILHRITRTDYLDDVSTRYIDPSLFDQYLSPENALMARTLHDRQAVLEPQHITVPGSKRGHSNKNDSYFTLQLKLGLIMGRERR